MNITIILTFFLLPLGEMLLVLLMSLDFLHAQFLTLKLGEMGWKQGTGNYIVYFFEYQAYLFADMTGA